MYLRWLEVRQHLLHYVEKPIFKKVVRSFRIVGLHQNEWLNLYPREFDKSPWICGTLCSRWKICADRTIMVQRYIGPCDMDGESQ